jgi:hypothetical protein
LPVVNPPLHHCRNTVTRRRRLLCTYSCFFFFACLSSSASRYLTRSLPSPQPPPQFHLGRPHSYVVRTERPEKNANTIEPPSVFMNCTVLPLLTNFEPTTCGSASSTSGPNRTHLLLAWTLNWTDNHCHQTILSLSLPVPSSLTVPYAPFFVCTLSFSLSLDFKPLLRVHLSIRLLFRLHANFFLICFVVSTLRTSCFCMFDLQSQVFASSSTSFNLWHFFFDCSTHFRSLVFNFQTDYRFVWIASTSVDRRFLCKT